MLDAEISIDNYKILRGDKSRQGRGAVCYVRHDLSYSALSVFPRQVENIFFETFPPNSKSIIVGIIYHPPKSR